MDRPTRWLLGNSHHYVSLLKLIKAMNVWRGLQLWAAELLLLATGKAPDELTAEQRRRRGGMLRKLSIMKVAGSLIGSWWESGSQRVEAGGSGVGVLILNFEEGNEVDHEEGLRGAVGSSSGVWEGGGHHPQLITLYSTIFFFDKTPPTILRTAARI